jgi:hypothetical protein
MQRAGSREHLWGQGKNYQKDEKHTSFVKLTGHRDKKHCLAMLRSRRWPIRSSGRVWTGMDARLLECSGHAEWLARAEDTAVGESLNELESCDLEGKRTGPLT